MNKQDMIMYIELYLNYYIYNFYEIYKILLLEVDEETALIDLYGYYVTGSYNWTIEDVYDDIKDKQND